MIDQARLSLSREKVVETRRAYPTWGARKIKAFLDDECGVSHQTVHEILVDEELVQPGPKARRVWRSWARRHGNSLWQMDFKQLTLDGWWFFRVFHHTPTTKDTIDVVLRAGRQWEPRQILTDRGTQFWSHHGPGEFTNTLQEHGIPHIKAARQKPTTPGRSNWRPFRTSPTSDPQASLEPGGEGRRDGGDLSQIRCRARCSGSRGRWSSSSLLSAAAPEGLEGQLDAHATAMDRTHSAFRPAGSFPIRAS